MSDQVGQSLSEAFALIEADRLDEARMILKPLLTTERDNPDVWWLYSHAVSDHETARLALNNVLNLAPDYPGAAELLEQLNRQAPAPRVLVVNAPDEEPPFLPPAVPATLPGLSEGVDDDTLDEEPDFDQEAESRTRLLLLAVAGIALVAIIVAIAVLTANPPPPVATPTPEQMALNPTTDIGASNVIPTITIAATQPPDATEPAVAATDDVEATPEETLAEMPTVSSTREPEPTATSEPEETPETGVGGGEAEPPFADYTTALAAYTLPEEAVQLEVTALGNTLMVAVCSAAGPELRAALPEVMDIVARQTPPDEAEAVGVRMLDCDDDTRGLLVIVVSAADAAAYAAGDITEEDFQSRWMSI